MIGLYRLLLRLYPRSFRTEFGDELVAVFAEELGRAGGPLGRLAVVRRAGRDR